MISEAGNKIQTGTAISHEDPKQQHADVPSPAIQVLASCTFQTCFCHLVALVTVLVVTTGNHLYCDGTIDVMVVVFFLSAFWMCCSQPRAMRSITLLYLKLGILHCNLDVVLDW